MYSCVHLNSICPANSLQLCPYAHVWSVLDVMNNFAEAAVSGWLCCGAIIKDKTHLYNKNEIMFCPCFRC